EVDFLTDVAHCNVQSARDLRPAFHPKQEHGLFYGARELGYFDILSFFWYSKDRIYKLTFYLCCFINITIALF
ncbi:MAG TPA: hypothetical protein VJB41_01320, partial [Patescibacteria group bacterium]|nr:hypothetical protein [Patescibacteria group bacterium]